jgi:hypothetical protein
MHTQHQQPPACVPSEPNKPIIALASRSKNTHLQGAAWWLATLSVTAWQRVHAARQAPIVLIHALLSRVAWLGLEALWQRCGESCALLLLLHKAPLVEVHIALTGRDARLIGLQRY